MASSIWKSNETASASDIGGNPHSWLFFKICSETAGLHRSFENENQSKGQRSFIESKSMTKVTGLEMRSDG